MEHARFYDGLSDVYEHALSVHLLAIQKCGKINGVFILQACGVHARVYRKWYTTIPAACTVETITLVPIIFLYCYFVHLNIFQ